MRVGGWLMVQIKTKMTQGIIDQRPGYEEDMVNSTVLKRGSTGDEYRGELSRDIYYSPR